jgi:hypothetical protein
MHSLYTGYAVGIKATVPYAFAEEAASTSNSSGSFGRKNEGLGPNHRTCQRF